MKEKLNKSALSGIAALAKEAVESGETVESNVAGTMMSREDAMNRIRDTHIIRTEYLNPSLCRPSIQNARDYSKLTAENCSDLIDSIRIEGSQHTAALVRPTGDPKVPYEIVTGSRRHFAVSWLRENNFPDIKYLVEIRDLTDEASFRLSDEENRARKDVSDLERARKYASALEAFYQGSVAGMAERLAINEKTLRRYLAVAAIPEEVIAAYGGQEVFTVSHARQIDPELRKGDREKGFILEEARAVSSEQDALRAASKPLIPPASVFARLAKAAKEKSRGGASRLTTLTDKEGRELLSYTAPSRVHGLNLKVAPKFQGNRVELLEHVTRIINEFYPE